MLQPKKKKATPKKKTGVSAERKASAKKLISRAIMSGITAKKGGSQEAGRKSLSKPSDWINKRAATHTATRNKAILKNVKSRIAKKKKK